MDALGDGGSGTGADASYCPWLMWAPFGVQAAFVHDRQAADRGDWDRAIAGVDAMPATGLEPLLRARDRMHVLDDLPPADAGVVCAERDLTLLCAVRNDAHLRATEVVRPEILEPHPADPEDSPVLLLDLLAIVPRIFP